MRFIVILSFFFLLISACGNTSDSRVIHSAYKPILIENTKINECVWEGEKASNQLVITRRMGQYLLSLDYGLGIHIIDAQDLNHPRKIGFYRIPACIDFEVKNQRVYANNYRDFIVVDFSNINSPNIIKRDPNMFLINIKTPDGLTVFESFKKTPTGTTIISYEKIKP